MADAAGTCHAVWVTYGNRTPGYVVLVRINAESIATVQALRSKRLVEFPQVDIRGFKPIALQQAGHCKHGTDAHLLRCAAGHGNRPVSAENRQTASLSQAALHEHNCGRSVR